MMFGLTVVADIFNQAVLANTNILSSNITPKQGCALRVTVAVETASVFNVTFTRSGVTKTLGLNESGSLNAGDLYTFTFGASTQDAVNFQVETAGTVAKLQVDEVVTGVI